MATTETAVGADFWDKELSRKDGLFPETNANQTTEDDLVSLGSLAYGEDQYHVHVPAEKVESPFAKQLQGDELRRFEEGSNRGHFAFTSGAVSVIKYPMYVMKFGLLAEACACDLESPPKKPLESHERLLAENRLVRWEDVPEGATIVFVSHEWLSPGHPDPKYVHTRTLCRMLTKLARGEVSVRMHASHREAYRRDKCTSPTEWKHLLSKKDLFVWFDWISMPQETAAGSSLRKDALISVPAYIDLCDLFVVICPDTPRVVQRPTSPKDKVSHAETHKRANYRSWRRRGWCRVEMFGALLSCHHTNTLLVIRSEDGTPHWLSPLDALMLPPGDGAFGDCDRLRDCDSSVVHQIMDSLVDAKVSRLFRAGMPVLARYLLSLKRFFLRDLNPRPTSTSSSGNVIVVDSSNETGLQRLRTSLQWRGASDDKLSATFGWSLLVYAVLYDDLAAVKEALSELGSKDVNARLKAPFADESGPRTRVSAFAIGSLRSATSSPPSSPIASPKASSTSLLPLLEDEPLSIDRVGLVHGATPLMMAMKFGSSPDVIGELLKAGASVSARDATRATALQWACRSPTDRSLDTLLCATDDASWDAADIRNSLFEAVRCRGGRGRHQIVRRLAGLVKKRGDVAAVVPREESGYVLDDGTTLLMAAIENPDVEVRVLDLILDAFPSLTPINERRFPRSARKRFFRQCAALFSRALGVQWTSTRTFGTSALHIAAISGDVELVERLLRAGADTSIQSGLGLTPIECARCYGNGGSHDPVVLMLQRHTDGNATTASASYLQRNARVSPEKADGK